MRVGVPFGHAKAQTGPHTLGGGGPASEGSCLMRSRSSSAVSTAILSPSNSCRAFPPLPPGRKYTSRSASPSRLAHLCGAPEQDVMILL